MSAIVSVCEDWGIGNDGKLLVRNKRDMEFFSSTTTGRTVVMGRSTLESLPGGKPLDNRRNIVLSRRGDLEADGIEIAHSIDEMLGMIGDSELVYVIGGATIYRQLLPMCARALVTVNHCIKPADAFFPDIGHSDIWKCVASSETLTIETGPDKGTEYQFLSYQRRSTASFTVLR